MEKHEEIWTKEHEIALNVFSNFMANILEKYGPIIEMNENKEENASDDCSHSSFIVLIHTDIYIRGLYNIGGITKTRWRCAQ